MDISFVRISRARSRVIAAGMLLLFFSVGLLFTRRTNLPVKELAPSSAPEPAELTAPVEAPETGSLFSLKEFHRSQIENGKVVWQLDATSGAFDPLNKTATLRSAHLISTSKSGDKLEVKAGKAHVLLEGTSLNSVDASDSVEVIIRDSIHIASNRMVLDHVSGDIRAPAEVTITSDTLIIKGNGLEGNLKTKEVKILREVSTTVQPKNNRG